MSANPVEASICDVFRIEPFLGVEPTRKLWGKYKSPTRDLIDFAIKTYYNLIFFYKFVIIICYFHILLPDSIISS